MSNLKVGDVIYYIESSPYYPYFNINNYQVSAIKLVIREETQSLEIESSGYNNRWHSGSFFTSKNEAINYLIDLLEEMKK